MQADWARMLNTTVPTKADLDLDLQDEDNILSRKLGGNSEKMQKCIVCFCLNARASLAF